MMILRFRVFFFFNDTATTEIYTLSLHDALPISAARRCATRPGALPRCSASTSRGPGRYRPGPAVRCRRACRPRLRGSRSEEHTSELQSRQYLVCRLLLEKKKTYLITSSL